MKDRLLKTVLALEGIRDGEYGYERLCEVSDYIEAEFSSLGFHIDYDEFNFSGKSYHNIIATTSGMNASPEWIAVCAHYDAVAGSPGADDNASGVASMIEAARLLGPRDGLKFIAFTLEEPQMTGASFLYGSKHFVKRVKKAAYRYKAVFNLESVGYVNKSRGSQSVPPLINVSDVGDFIALVGNKGSEQLMDLFELEAGKTAPTLKLFKHRALISGYLLPPTRFSDHAPFWDAGYPAVMITDTAMMRNPNYHTRHDTSDTISLEFMKQVTKALVKTVEGLLD
ncbi:MAG: M28 family peptidase [bacterium]|nr:M28 family peptidase [bacterium]